MLIEKGVKLDIGLQATDIPTQTKILPELQSMSWFGYSHIKCAACF